jgi:glycosyltransferase involved in cell wall biosynthesis
VRILLVRSVSTGGVGVHVAALADELRRGGHRVAVLEAVGRRAVPAIRRAAKNADVVHAHGLRAGAAACLAVDSLVRLGPASRKRVVVTLHNPPPPTRLGGLVERVIARRADVVLGASEDLVDRARRLKARDARFAPVTAALGRPTKSREQAREEFDLEPGAASDPQSDTKPDPKPDPKLVLAVGRLAAQKDYATLLDAARRSIRSGSHSDGASEHPLTFAIAGDGPLRAELQARIDADRLPVRLLGHRADIPGLLAAADVFVICSSWEARPLALQEAMRAGLPCVATAVGGIPGLVGTAAALIRPGDSSGLLRAIVDRLAAPAEHAEAARRQAATWPGRAEETAAALAAYRR